jgi:hypothetical protein
MQEIIHVLEGNRSASGGPLRQTVIVGHLDIINRTCVHDKGVKIGQSKDGK